MVWEDGDSNVPSYPIFACIFRKRRARFILLDLGERDSRNVLDPALSASLFAFGVGIIISDKKCTHDGHC